MLKWSTYPLYQYNYTVINGAKVLYTEGFNINEFVLSTNPSALPNHSFSAETNLTRDDGKTSFVFKTNGTCTITRTNNTGSWEEDKSYAYYDNFNYILIGNDWYKFVSDTVLRMLADGPNN